MSDAGRALAGRALTDEQERAAARRSEDLLLSAAAGSGKTLVLVERFVRAVREDGLAPGRSWRSPSPSGPRASCASGSARACSSSASARRHATPRPRSSGRSTASARACCGRTPPRAGLDPEFTILDDPLAGRLRSRALRLALGGFLEGERPQAVDLVAAYGIDRVGSMILSVHAELRSRGQREPRLPPVGAGEPGDELHAQAAAACAELDRLLVGFSAAYERLKRERGAVDFDDLELLACELLQREESVRASWAARFELLMVDEFQDTNPRQLEILRCLERGNLFTVGDELQSIYGFRHADVRLFRDRRAQLAQAGASLALTRNFRSAAAVLEAVNALFRDRFDPFTPLVPARGADDAGAAGAARRAARHRPHRVGRAAGPRRRARARAACGRAVAARRGARARRADRRDHPPGRRAAGRDRGAAARRRRPARLRARARRARRAHARGRRRLLGAPAGRRPARVPARARQPARRARPLRSARLAAGRPLERFAGAAREGGTRARRRALAGGERRPARRHRPRGRRRRGARRVLRDAWPPSGPPRRCARCRS